MRSFIPLTYCIPIGQKDLVAEVPLLLVGWSLSRELSTTRIEKPFSCFHSPKRLKISLSLLTIHLRCRYLINNKKNVLTRCHVQLCIGNIASTVITYHFRVIIYCLLMAGITLHRFAYSLKFYCIYMCLGCSD